VTEQTLASVALMAGSNEDALEMAVREHAQLVYRVAYSVLRNHHDAEDATQETFMRVVRYKRKLEGIQDSRTWLARIAWRCSRRGHNLASRNRSVVRRRWASSFAGIAAVCTFRHLARREQLTSRVSRCDQRPLTVRSVDTIQTPIDNFSWK